jgi:hypothetical protein
MVKNFFSKIGERFRNMDKDDLGKWGLLIASGLLGLGANWFDQRKKDRLYKEGLKDDFEERFKKLTESTDE